MPPGLYSIQNRPEAPDALNSDKRGGRGSGQPFFGKKIFHFFVAEIGKILTTSRCNWPFPGLADDLGIAVISGARAHFDFSTCR